MNEPSHRRDFVRAIALGGAAAAVGQPAASQAAADDPPPEPTEADLRTALILARYGKFLDDEQLAFVRADVEAIVRRGEQLRQFELANGDEPMPTFAPYRAPLA